jgi:DNA replication factor GINS
LVQRNSDQEGGKIEWWRPVRKEDIKKYEDNSNEHMNAKAVTIKEVYKLLLKEVQMPTLQSIPFDTYKTIASTLESLKEQEYDGMDANVRDKIVKLMSISVNLLLDIRRRKLLEQHGEGQVQNGDLSSLRSTILPAVDYSKLTDEEKYILDAEREFDRRKMAVLAATLQGRPKVLESISSRILSKQMVVRFIKPMEQFIGVNMTRYGPFQEEDVAVIPFENARSLLENGIAVQLDIQPIS